MIYGLGDKLIDRFSDKLMDRFSDKLMDRFISKLIDGFTYDNISIDRLIDRFDNLEYLVRIYKFCI